MHLSRFVLFAATVVTFLSVAAVASGAVGITPAPAWTGAELSAPAGDNWITTGGNIRNERYSTLTQVNSGNVSGLQQAWRVDLDNSGVAGKYSQEATPIVYQGVMYIVTGNNDVFALDAATGERIWTYLSRINQKIDTICCGWDSRGVAIGDSKLFVSQLDGFLVALDQATGNVIWRVANVNWREGYSQTSSATYYNGMVYTGSTGGEFGARGHITAYDADTGQRVWRFFNCPTPGEFGGQTWALDEWMTCGATVWNNPSIDVETNTLYYTTANADPWASRGPGANLFSASYVALNASTGQYVNHYQIVHHDIWDYDCPSPTVIFDITIDGQLREGITEACKTGYLYTLDRNTMTSLIPGGIPEVRVPQNRQQHTWPTQPVPKGDAFAALRPRARDFRELAPDGKPYKIGRLWTPPNINQFVVVAPSAGGGTNWPPTSYSRDLGYAFVCSQDSAYGFKPVRDPFADYEGGETFIGVAFGKFVTWGGTFTAMDLRTNKKVWQKRFADGCYSGSVATAGNLVFVGLGGPSFEKGVGRGNFGGAPTTGGTGELRAYDATTGARLWTGETDAGANAPAITYAVNGKQYVAILAGGNTFNSPRSHGDSMYAFTLP
jgi:PQQ-dependent dehydrogenase (methanol/ethanol family)